LPGCARSRLTFCQRRLIYRPYVSLAAAKALDGKPEDAKSALAEGRRLQPNLTIKWLAGHAPNIPPLFEGLREAGLPEG